MGLIMRKIFIFVIMLFIAGNINLRADGDLDEVKANLPKMLGTSQMGTEFYLTFFPAWEVSGSGNFMKIFFTSTVDTRVTVEIEGIYFEKSIKIKAGEVSEFNMSPGDAMPYSKGDRDAPLAEQVFEGRGIHITAEDPVLVYGMTRYHYTSDGYLALPLHCLGKKYIVASYMDTDGTTQYLSSYTAIVATHDETELEFTLGGHDGSMTAGGMVYGEMKPFSMNSSDVVLIGSVGKHSDLTGSVIDADKPVAVVSGNFCVYIPKDKGYCDYTIEMEIPTEIWGRSYNVSPIHERKIPGIIKIFAKESDTRIFRGTEEIGMLKTAGGGSGEGWLEMRASEITKAPVAVNISGDKPINVVYYNTGSREDSVESDPFQMNILSERHYSKYHEFITPGVNGGRTFRNNYANIVYRATESGEIPEEMYLGRYIEGVVEWSKLKDVDSFPGMLIDGTDKDGRSYYSKKIGINPVDHVFLKCNDDFAVQVYGQSDDDSYGYIAGGVLTDMNIYDNRAPVLISEEGSGNSISGEFADLAGDSEEISGMAMLFLIGSESENYTFSRDAWSWELDVEDVSKAARAVLYACDKRGNDTLIEYLYLPSGLIASCNKLEFKDCTSGEDYEQSFNLQNLNDEVISIESIALAKGENFSIVSNELSQIGAESQEELKIKFSAGSEAEYSDELVVNYGDSKEVRVALLGYVKSMSVATREEKDVVCIYPNPVRGDELRVDLGNSGAFEFDIYDIDGRVLKSVKTGSDRVMKLDISDLLSGKYVLVLKGHKGIVATESFTVVR